MSSLRWRTAIAFALLGTIVALSMGVGVYRTSVADRGARLREVALQRARAGAAIYQSTGEVVGAVTVNDQAAPRAMRDAVNAGAAATDLVRNGTSTVVWAGVPLVGGAHPAQGLYVATNADEDAAALASLSRTLVFTATIIAIIAALAGLVLATGLSRRLRLAAAGARTVADGDFNARIAISGTDEVAALGAAVDAMADALAARVRHEREFNANVAHELRTPVTGLIAAAALLPDGDPVTALIRGRGQRLHRLVEDLLEVSRLEGGFEVANIRPVDLRAFLSDVLAPYDGIRVVGESAATIETDPRRLERIVVNVIDNALQHGARPVTVSIEEQALVVTDAGPGFPVDMLERATDRFVTRSGRDGTGLGLAIASEQARVLGARLHLSNATPRGAVATIVWPPRAEEPA